MNKKPKSYSLEFLFSKDGNELWYEIDRSASIEKLKDSIEMFCRYRIVETNTDNVILHGHDNDPVQNYYIWVNTH